MGEPDPLQPRMIGRYAVYEKIASGGMASVHLGRLLGPVGFARTVAIKRMHPQFAGDPEFVSMFLDEARLAARIRHPHVVPTLDVVARDGELFLVMEFVQGESLARLIRGATARDEFIPVPMVTTIMAGVLHGLHAAHEATNERGEPLEIVHRDVSPHNVIVGTDGVARVLDFGVAKAAGRLQTTRDGQIKGKMAYMAPEQVRGTVTRKTDVYAAAVVLWETLAGKRLFFGDNDAHVLEQVLRGCSEPPSKHNPGVPAALDAVTMRGLSVDAGARFPTAHDMACALEEATPLMTATKIGEWVSAAAHDTLLERSVRIATIESDSSARVPDSLRHSVPDRTRTEPAPVPPADDGGTQTQLSSASSPPAPHAARSRATRLAAAGGLAAIALVVVVSWRAIAPPSSTGVANPVASTALAAAAVDSAVAPAAPATPSPPPSPSPAPSSSAPQTTARAPGPSGAARPATRPADAPRQPAKPNPLDLPLQ